MLAGLRVLSFTVAGTTAIMLVPATNAVQAVLYLSAGCVGLGLLEGLRWLCRRRRNGR